MTNSIEFKLCNSDFLDLNLTWYTSEPRLSECFRDTALSWIPACLFILVITNESSNIQVFKSTFKTVPWNLYNRFKLGIILLLFLFGLYQTVVVINELDNQLLVTNNDQVIVSRLLAPTIQTLCYAILAIIYYFQREAGIRTSCSIWFYLLASILCLSLSLYTVPSSTQQPRQNQGAEFILNCFHLAVLSLLFVFECWGDTPDNKLESSSKDVCPVSPELQASFFSKITFSFNNRFLMLGYRSRLHLTDLWQTLHRDKASKLVPEFLYCWVYKVSSAPCGKSKQNGTYRLATGEVRPFNGMLRTLGRLFWAKMLFAASLKLLQDCLQYATPMLLKSLLAFIALTDAPTWHGILIASLLLIVPFIKSIVAANYLFRVELIGLQIRTMMVGAVYRKALLLSGSSRLQSTSGEIVNLMAVDSERFKELLEYFNLIWSAPLQIIVAIILLYFELGWSIFPGIIIMISILLLNAYLANILESSQTSAMKTKDKRIKQTNELLSGIKVVKLYAWENSFISNLLDFRKNEMKCMKSVLNICGLQTFLWHGTSFLVACVSFAVYVNADPSNVLDAEKAFVSISLLNLLQLPLYMLPPLCNSLVLTMVSSRRLRRFLNNEELVRYVSRNQESEAISIEGGTLSWSNEEAAQSRATKDTQTQEPHRDSNAIILRNVDLHVKPKSFVAIVGQVASGKSSLLASILGEMHRIAGRFNVCKSMSMAYVPQQPWIQNMTVEENITFGTKLDKQRYDRVIKACSLQSDLEMLTGGHQAEIGEKGINLSGGQKQRVSLARACYSDSDIYLLDDPLSALDSHVAKHVFDEVLSSQTGLLKDKTRVLATNNLFVLPYVDEILVLNGGKVVESGTYQELIDKKQGHLAEFMRQYSVNQRSKSDDQEAEPKKVTSIRAKPSESVRDEYLENTLETKADSSGKLIEEEKVKLGRVGLRVYLKYFQVISIPWLVVVATPMIMAISFNISTNFWLSIWVTDAEDPEKSQDDELQKMRLIVYAILGTLQCCSGLLGALAMTKRAVRAAGILYSQLLERVMHSPMQFFDTTPIGRIVNRFAKDIDKVDYHLPLTLRYWFECLLQVLSTIFVVSYSFPTFLIMFVPLGIVYCLIQRMFIAGTRQLKRLESTTLSPIYSNFNETLSGMSTIRAYDCVDRFVHNSDNLIDRNRSCAYHIAIAKRWLSVRLELIGALVNSVSALISVYYKGTIGAGVAGLIISYSLKFTDYLDFLVWTTSDLETDIVSVERILEYSQIKQEDRWIKEESRPALDWPTSGQIEISNLSTRYREDTDLVLKNVSISIKPREKVGIVGRTGSGKSSLSLALFRIMEPAEGAIKIDNLNLADFGLHDIRSKLTIIPQDPILFSGTIRFNLDPLKLYSDMDIWRALESAHLKPYISSLDSGLDYQVSEYGENFSLGQRQLICLARAILRKSKILILDEATASVDVETDSIVQRTIRDIFSDCTIITIAHRLHTILDSNRILVLDSGRVLELDSPENLISDPKSAFASLVRDAGIETESMIQKRRSD